MARRLRAGEAEPPARTDATRIRSFGWLDIVRGNVPPVSDQEKLEALTVVCGHLIDCIDSMFTTEGTGNLARSAVGNAIAPSLQQAKDALNEVYASGRSNPAGA